jgi:hypothetical protein
MVKLRSIRNEPIVVFVNRAERLLHIRCKLGLLLLDARLQVLIPNTRYLPEVHC